MPHTLPPIAPALVFTCVIASPALADTKMDQSQLRALIEGNTLYVEVPPGAPGAPEGGIAPIYYAADGATSAQLPAGPKLVGTWSLEGDRYCIDWQNGPQNSCTALVRKADSFLLLDAKLGEPRGRVTRIATGNPENL